MEQNLDNVKVAQISNEELSVLLDDFSLESLGVDTFSLLESDDASISDSPSQLSPESDVAADLCRFIEDIFFTETLSSDSHHSVNFTEDCLSSDATSQVVEPEVDQSPEAVVHLPTSNKRAQNADINSKNEILCRVCKNPGGKHFNFYGCHGVCTSCRSFFRRSVKTEQYKDFRCKSTSPGSPGSVCTIDSKNRKSCKKCRFERCISKGMRVKWVQLPVTSAIMVKSGPKRFLSLAFTIEEKSYIEMLKKAFFDIIYGEYYLTFGQNFSLLQQWLEICKAGGPYSYNFLKSMEIVDTRAATRGVLSLLSSEGLDVDERCSLVQANLKIYLAYSWAFYSDIESGQMFVKGFLDYGFQHREIAEVQKVMKFLRDSNVSLGETPYSYDQIFSSPWASSEDTEKEHLRITQLFKQWSDPSKSGVDDVQVTIFELMLILTHEGTHLEPQKKKKIESLQLKFTLMLQRYLKDKYPKKYSSKFGSGVMLLHHAKELCQLHSQRLAL